MCRTLIRTFNDTVVVTVIFYAVVCWVSESTKKDRKQLNKLVKRGGLREG